MKGQRYILALLLTSLWLTLLRAQETTGSQGNVAAGKEMACESCHTNVEASARGIASGGSAPSQ